MSANPAAITSFPNLAALKATPAAQQLLGQVIYLQGYYNPGDGGGGSFVCLNTTPLPVNDGGLNVYASTSGYYFQRIVDGPYNIKWWGADSNGTFDNTLVFQRNPPGFWRAMAKTLAPTIPVAITISIANPAVISWPSHGLRVNEAVQFSTTGALPTGITAGVTYYVLAAGLTADAFQISTTNAWTLRTGYGAAVITTGSQSGTQSIVVTGFTTQEWVIPPGAYFSSSVDHISGNQRYLKLSAYGAQHSNLAPSTNFNIMCDYNNADNLGLWALIDTITGTSGGSSPEPQITLVTSSQSALFSIGGWVCLCGLDLQSSFGTESSFPPNNHYFEFKKVIGINSGTGVITLDSPLQYSYKSTYPTFYGGVPAPGPGIEPTGGGAAVMIPICSDWDMTQEVIGLTSLIGAEIATTSRKMIIRDCFFYNGGAIPSVCKEWIAENCFWNSNIEVDKLIELLVFKKCDIPSSVEFQSTSVNNAVIEDSSVLTINGTPKNLTVRNSVVTSLGIGPLLFGATESLTLENSKISQIAPTARLDDVGHGVAGVNLVNLWTFSNGTLKTPIATTFNNWWAVPGRAMFINDMAGVNYNMGSPFLITDVYQDGSGNFCIDTTLAVDPTTLGGSTNSTVTISIANPAVITWTSHGLTAGTPVMFFSTGTLPAGMSNQALYYVLASGLTSNTFEFSASPGGSPIATSGTQSGTQKAVSNPLHYEPHPCPRITATNCTGCTEVVDLCKAPANSPLYSFGSRRFIGFFDSTPSFIPPLPIMGALVLMTVNVSKAYTGSTSPFNMTISGNGFDASLAAANFSEVIDLTVAGVRTVTATGTTGSTGNDSLAAYAHWLAGTVKFAVTTPSAGTWGQFPVVDITIQTDQGVTKSFPINIQGPTDAHESILTDTSPGVSG